MDTEKIWEAVKEYSEGLERVTLSSLIAIHQGMNVINLGPPGQGKTYCTRTLFDKLGIKYILVAGHKSPKEFFEVFKQDLPVVIDESATLIRNQKIMDMLLSALWDGSVEWSNNREHNKVIFKSIIIFNTNSMPNNTFMEALRDRCIFNEVKLNSDQLKNIWRKEQKDYKNEWTYIKKMMDKIVQLSKDEETEVNNIIESLSIASLRTPIKLKQIAAFLKTVFGSIDKLKLFADYDEVYEIFVDKKIKRSEKVKKISKLRKVSERQANNILKKYEMIYKGGNLDGIGK